MGLCGCVPDLYPCMRHPLVTAAAAAAVLVAPKQLLAQVLANRLQMHEVAIPATVAGVLLCNSEGQHGNVRGIHIKSRPSAALIRRQRQA